MEPSKWRLMTTDKNRQTRRNLNTMARLHYTVARSAVKVKFHAVKATSTLTLSNKTYHIESTQPVHIYISLRSEMSTTDRVCVLQSVSSSTYNLTAASQLTAPSPGPRWPAVTPALAAWGWHPPGSGAPRYSARTLTSGHVLSQHDTIHTWLHT